MRELFFVSLFLLFPVTTFAQEPETEAIYSFLDCPSGTIMHNGRACYYDSNEGTLNGKESDNGLNIVHQSSSDFVVAIPGVPEDVLFAPDSGKISAMLSYKNHGLVTAVSDSKGQVTFENKDFVTVELDRSDCISLSMADSSNEICPNVVFTTPAAGSLSVKKEGKGYLVSGRGLKELDIYTKSDQSDLRVFDTQTESLLVTIDRGSMVVYEDTDRDGTFETDVWSIIDDRRSVTGTVSSSGAFLDREHMIMIALVFAASCFFVIGFLFIRQTDVGIGIKLMGWFGILFGLSVWAVLGWLVMNARVLGR